MYEVTGGIMLECRSLDDKSKLYRLLFCGRLNRKRDAINGSAINFDIFADGFAAVWFCGDAILGRFGCEAKNEGANLVGDAAINLLRRAVVFYSRELNPNVRHAAITSLKTLPRINAMEPSSTVSFNRSPATAASPP